MKLPFPGGKLFIIQYYRWKTSFCLMTGPRNENAKFLYHNVFPNEIFAIFFFWANYSSERYFSASSVGKNMLYVEEKLAPFLKVFLIQAARHVGKNYLQYVMAWYPAEVSIKPETL